MVTLVDTDPWVALLAPEVEANAVPLMEGVRVFAISVPLRVTAVVADALKVTAALRVIVIEGVWVSVASSTVAVPTTVPLLEADTVLLPVIARGLLVVLVERVLLELGVGAPVVVMLEEGVPPSSNPSAVAVLKGVPLGNPPEGVGSCETVPLALRESV